MPDARTAGLQISKLLETPPIALLWWLLVRAAAVMPAIAILIGVPEPLKGWALGIALLAILYMAFLNRTDRR